MSQTSSSYPYASVRVKALELRLITKEKLARLIETDGFDAGMRVLAEFGYGHGVSGTDFELLITKELAETDALLAALSPSDIFTRIMRLERDYQNLKVIVKLLLRDKNLADISLAPGNLSIETLLHAITDNNYHDLPEPMKEALTYIDSQFAVAADASIVGVALDRAYAKDVTRQTQKLGNPLVSEYFRVFFDLTNIIALLRVRASKADKAVFERAYLYGGEISRRVLSDAFETADESFLSSAAKGAYSSVLAEAFADYQKSGSLYMLEKARDDYLLSLLRKNRFDMFGIGPLMGYFLAKQREAASVRMVMTAKQGGIEAEIVSKRLKQLYI
ncbi:MAG: V-type ATPase subunit [Christensenellales bacterium]